MTPEIILGLVRSVLLIAFSSLLAKGTITASTIDQLAGAIGSILVVWLSVRAKLKTGKKVEALKTVVATKVAETHELRAAVSESQAITGVMVGALLEAKVPIPELPPTTKPAVADPIVDIQPNNLSKP